MVTIDCMVQSPNHKRIDEMDWLKFVFILLMIAFHLVYIGDTYPVAKRFVYTFHMPAFLLISGYMINIRKSSSVFLRSMMWIAVPYLLVEAGYVIMSSILPIREHIDCLNVCVFLDKLLLHPLGPYWYLHTLVLCGVSAFVVMHMPHVSRLSCFIVLGLIYGALSCLLGVLSLVNGMYFLAGLIVRQCGISFLSFFRPSWWSLPVILWLASDSSNFDKSLPSGMLLVYLMISLNLVIYPYIRGVYVRRCVLYVGRHTLLLLVFSPVFTILAKFYQPFLLSLEPSGMLFMFVSVAFAVLGSLGVGYVCDCLHLSPWIFGRQRVLL